MNFSEAWEFLYNLQLFKIKLGLESMERFLAAVGDPHKDLRFVHVAGTNGKGSVSATLLAVLARAGYRVGLYTSPHLVSVRERFRINDALVSEEDFAGLATVIREVLDNHQITYFEFTTALALLWFAREKVDMAILEVGMGGRLDATNVIRPEVALITNVALDHEAHLGNTLAEIAREKAGIIKPLVPVISGVADDKTREIVIRTCADLNAPLYLLGRDFSVSTAADNTWTYKGIFTSHSGLRCRLVGRHQTSNSALALAALEILDKKDARVDEAAVRTGLMEVSWPGRLEHFQLPAKPGSSAPEPRRYLLDGAHNPAAVNTLKEALKNDFSFDRLILVWASMLDKDYRSMLAIIAPLATHIVLTAVGIERAAPPQLLQEALPPECRLRSRCVFPVTEALTAAAGLAGPRDLICISGSLYLVGEARHLLLVGQAANGVGR